MTVRARPGHHLGPGARAFGGLLGLTCSLGVLGPAFAGGGSKTMPSTNVMVAKVAGFEDAGGTADATLRFGDGTSCRLERSHAQFAYFAKLLPGEAAAGNLVYAECDPQSGTLLDVQLPLRKIEKVAPAPGRDRRNTDLHARRATSSHHRTTLRALAGL